MSCCEHKNQLLTQFHIHCAQVKETSSSGRVKMWIGIDTVELFSSDFFSCSSTGVLRPLSPSRFHHTCPSFSICSFPPSPRRCTYAPAAHRFSRIVADFNFEDPSYTSRPSPWTIPRWVAARSGAFEPISHLNLPQCVLSQPLSTIAAGGDIPFPPHPCPPRTFPCPSLPFAIRLVCRRKGLEPQRLALCWLSIFSYAGSQIASACPRASAPQ